MPVAELLVAYQTLRVETAAQTLPALYPADYKWLRRWMRAPELEEFFYRATGGGWSGLLPAHPYARVVIAPDNAMRMRRLSMGSPL